MSWRAEDEALLQRLEDETVAAAWLPVTAHPRAAGLIASLRKVPGGAEAVRAAVDGDVSRVASFARELDLTACPPELLHHLALFHSKSAEQLELTSPETATADWVRSLAAWLALVEERSYLETLAARVLGDGKGAAEIGFPVDQVPLQVIAEIAKRADASTRSLDARGRAALSALAATAEATTMAKASSSVAQRVRDEALRRRSAAIDAALGIIGEALDEAGSRGELAAAGRAHLLRVVPVWVWSGLDHAVEHFVVERVGPMGWELYRAEKWDLLREVLGPLRPIFDSLARRIERDPAELAYSAACAQMFVFLAETSRSRVAKRELAERSLKICPTHRNGRLVLASVLCDDAMEDMSVMVVIAQRKKLEQIEADLVRAESLYPATPRIGEARAALERLKKSRIVV